MLIIKLVFLKLFYFSSKFINKLINHYFLFTKLLQTNDDLENLETDSKSEGRTSIDTLELLKGKIF